MPHNLKRELAGIALIALALFIGGALLLQDLPIEGGCLAARGVFGPVGGCLKGALLSVVGEPAAWLLALLPLVHGLRLLGRMQWETDRRWLLFLAGLVLLLPIVVGLATGTERRTDGPAGLWGGFVAFYLGQTLGTGGAWLAVAVLASALTAWSLRWNPVTAAMRAPGGKAARSDLTPAALAMEPPPEEMPAMVDGRRETGEGRRRAKRADVVALPEPAEPEPLPTVVSTKKASGKGRAQGRDAGDRRGAGPTVPTRHPGGRRAGGSYPVARVAHPPASRQRRCGAEGDRGDGGQAHGGAAHLQGRREAGRADDRAGRDTVRGGAGVGREGPAVRQPRQ
ncbi:MAG: DNA translocase FtsK 4TM domain-containing protein [Gemmatimonadetes bacterium]|nr:DNA translocase FtsK 4TM domain-containing protein [Gemmatimonadota bacterium]